MRIFSSTFPSGPLGIGLLLLRLTFTLRFAKEAVDRITTAIGRVDGVDLGDGSIGLVLIVCAALMALGFLTSLIAILGAIVEVASHSAPLRTLGWAALTGGMVPTQLFEAEILVCLALMGPGVYSIDAGLFGREEIIIRPRTHVHHE